MTTADEQRDVGEALADFITALVGPRPASPPPDRRTSRAAARNNALRAARAQGCVCNPDITVTHAVDGVPDVRVAHDDWCPMLNHGPQLVAYHRPPGHPRRSPR